MMKKTIIFFSLMSVKLTIISIFQVIYIYLDGFDTDSFYLVLALAMLLFSLLLCINNKDKKKGRDKIIDRIGISVYFLLLLAGSTIGILFRIEPIVLYFYIALIYSFFGITLSFVALFKKDKHETL